MVTAISFGACLRVFLSSLVQRTASTSSAVESGPPETAKTRPDKASRPENSAFASSSRTACSAVDTLLFPIHGLLHIRRSARIFTQYLTERSAGCFLLAQGRKRLPKPQQCVGRARHGVVFGRDRKKRLRRVAIALILEQAFAEPILRLRRQPIGRIFVQEIAERIRRGPIVLMQDIAVGEIVF